MRSLKAVGSTIHSMIKFHTDQGVVAMETSRETLREYKHLERVQGSWKELQWCQQDNGKGLGRSKRMKRGNTLGGVKEGKFLGHMVTEEGLRADPERIQAIILSPTPRSPNQIRSLFLQLTTISKFIPKLVELKHPIREARMRMETAKEVGWTNEAEEALRG
ncbi:hypothetical protein Tco_0541407 [Tanacetum coccineum]